jgi:hypothetical protein
VASFRDAILETKKEKECIAQLSLTTSMISSRFVQISQMQQFFNYETSSIM